MVLIDRFGGAKELRDQAALESAAERPQVGYYEDVIQEACALLESLAINHPFLDGNKRIAFAAFDVLLRLNGYRIQLQPMEIHRTWMELFDSGEFRFAPLEKYFRRNLQVVEPRQ